MPIYPTTVDPSPKNAPSFAERRLSLIILAILAIIALSILQVQNHFDPARWGIRHPQPADGSGSPQAPAAVDSFAIAGVLPMSAPERYDAVSLSDKIDGKAELYLSAGFKSLDCQRLALSSDPALWMERFVYDMGDYRNAFAVFSRQRREKARPLNLTPDAYQSANGIFLVQGNYYLEIVGSDPSAILVEKMIDLAQAFVKAHPATDTKLDEPSFFPEKNRVTGTISLTAVNAFGFDRFDHIFTAQYQWQRQTATAFVSRRASADEARALAEAYADFLITYGGQRIEPPTGSPPLVVIEILDMYEIIFSSDKFLAGVHESDTLEHGLALAKQLYDNLGVESHGP